MIPNSQVRHFSQLCFDLGNKELIELLFLNDPPSLENIASRLELHMTDSDVGYACEHFISFHFT
jgi:hypothetical protein